MDDWQLLNDYATRNSEEAFRTLVERYAGMVYHTALRQVGNPHSAEEVSQAVFIILARKAAKIRRQPTLYGWLFRATRFAVLNQRRQEKNRVRREQEAYAMQSASNPDDLNPIWEQITPHLDDALHKLPVTDRELVMIRYFGNKSHKEAAQTLGVSENVVRKRLSRAMEKLRVIFARRGVAVSSLALVAAFTAQGVQAAPLGLALSLTSVAVAKGATAGVSTLTLVKGILKLMAWTKAKTAIAVGVGVILAAGTTSIVIEEVESPSVDESLWEMKLENLKKAPPVLIIRPARFSDDTAMVDNKRIIAHHVDFENLLAFAYAFTNSEGQAQAFSSERMILPPNAPKSRYDLMFTLPNHPIEKLQQAISRTTGFEVRKEIRQTDVFLLNVKDPALFALHASKKGTRMNHKQDNNMWAAFNQPISDTARYLEGVFQKPVLAPPDLSGRYDFTFQWQARQLMEEALSQELEKAGLELVPTNMPIEMLVVEKAGN